MVSPPRKNHRNSDTNQNYLFMFSFLPLKHSWRIPQFFRHVARINKQLDTAPGILGCTFQAEILRKRFWTLSIREDEKTLHNFVKTKPHSETMTEIHPHMRPPKFIKWMSKGSILPPTWDDAKRHFDEEKST